MGDFVVVPCEKAEDKYAIQIDGALVDVIIEGLIVQNHTEHTVSIQKGMIATLEGNNPDIE
jgi:hypothetical protein